MAQAIPNGRYLSQSALDRIRRNRRLQRGFGWPVTVFFALSVILALTDKEGTLRDGLSVYAVLLLPGLYLLWRSYENSKLLGQANRYGTLFASDRNGTVTIDELTRQTGLASGKVLAQLERLFRMGVFQHCSLQRGGVPCVLLDDAEDGQAGYVAVRCPNCGGTTRILAGRKGQCEYCGSAIRGK